MAGIEFSILSRACLRRRNTDDAVLTGTVCAYVTQRSSAGATTDGRFNTQDAGTKLRRLYTFKSKID